MIVKCKLRYMFYENIYLKKTKNKKTVSDIP